MSLKYILYQNNLLTINLPFIFLYLFFFSFFFFLFIFLITLTYKITEKKVR